MESVPSGFLPWSQDGHTAIPNGGTANERNDTSSR